MSRLEALRTPDACFENLPGYDFEPRYHEVDGLRIHYLDEGPREADPVLLLHGEPSWSYLYRKMIPVLAQAGHHVVAPDLVGFGRSDKPVRKQDYTYARHVGWMRALLEALDLRHITLVCQDWGGLIGLRLAAENSERFARIVAANTGLPTGERKPSEAFFQWRRASQEMNPFPVGKLIQGATTTTLPDEVVAAYDAPFPDERYKAGAIVFPVLVPVDPDAPGAPENREAWKVFSRWSKPFLTAFSDRDPITRGADKPFRKHIPGAQGQPHTTVENGGHFLQEDQGEALAKVVVDFIAANPR